MTVATSMVDYGHVLEGENIDTINIGTANCLIGEETRVLGPAQEQNPEAYPAMSTVSSNDEIAGQQSPTSAAELLEEEGVDDSGKNPESSEAGVGVDEDEELLNELEKALETPEEESASQLVSEEELPVPGPSPVQSEMKSSLAKGHTELCKSRQKAHAGKGLPPRTNSSRKLLSASAHASSGRHKVARSTSDDLSGAVVRSDHTKLRRFASSRGFTEESEQKLRSSTRNSTVAGSLATPRKRASKKLTMEDMDMGKMNKASKHLDLCAPKRRHVSRSKSAQDTDLSPTGSNTSESSVTKTHRYHANSSETNENSSGMASSSSHGDTSDAEAAACSGSMAADLEKSEEEPAPRTSEGLASSAPKEGSDPDANVTDSPPSIGQPQNEEPIADSNSDSMASPGNQATSEEPPLGVEVDDANGLSPSAACSTTHGDESTPEGEARKEEGSRSNETDGEKDWASPDLKQEEFEATFFSDFGQEVQPQEESTNLSFGDFSAFPADSENEASKLSQGYSITGEEPGSIAADWDFGSENAFASSSQPDEEGLRNGEEVKFDKNVPAGKGPWTCRACLYPNVDKNHLFCGMCGTGRAWCCSSCDSENKSSFRYCSKCGGQKGRPIINAVKDVEQERPGRLRLPQKKPSNSREKPFKTDRSVCSEGEARPMAGQRTKRAGGEPQHRRPRSGSSDFSSEDPRKIEKRTSRGRSKAAEECTSEAQKAVKKHPGRPKEGDRVHGEGAGRRKARTDERNNIAEKQSEKQSGRPRRSRNSSSVPPAERRDGRSRSKERDSCRDMPKDKASRSGDSPPQRHRSSSLTRMDKSNAQEGEGPVLLRGWDSSGNSSAVLGSTTDHGVVQGRKDYEHDTNRRVDVLATPSIKKRLLKMGKFGGKKMFNAPDLQTNDDQEDDKKEPRGPAERVSRRNLTGGKSDGFVPTTPSFKNRLFKKIPWGKAESGRIELPLEDEESMNGEESVVEEEMNEHEEHETPEPPPAPTVLEDPDPLDGLSSGGIVFTAKDLRSNRPETSRRKQVSSQSQHGSAKGSNHHDVVSRPDKKKEGQPRRPRRGDRDRRPVVDQDSDHTAEMSSSHDPLEAC